jgi:hypothetical protein
MSNSIINIKNFFDRHKGVQRPNRFSLEFVGLPSSIREFAPTNDDLQLLAVDMGTRAIDVVYDNLIGYGPGRAVPRSQKFVGGVLLTFPVTGDNFIIRFFDAWFNSIYNGSLVNYYDTIVKGVNMNINVLDLNGNITTKFQFEEVYPIETLPFSFKMDDKNTFLTHTVLMNYRKYTLS